MTERSQIKRNKIHGPFSIPVSGLSCAVVAWFLKRPFRETPGAAFFILGERVAWSQWNECSCENKRSRSERYRNIDFLPPTGFSARPARHSDISEKHSVLATAEDPCPPTKLARPTWRRGFATAIFAVIARHQGSVLSDANPETQSGSGTRWETRARNPPGRGR